jgi:hypothetical protein
MFFIKSPVQPVCFLRLDLGIWIFTCFSALCDVYAH